MWGGLGRVGFTRLTVVVVLEGPAPGLRLFQLDVVCTEVHNA